MTEKTPYPNTPTGMLEMGKVNKTENPSLTTAQQMYETKRLAAENKRLKRTIDEYLECIMSKDDQIVELELKVEKLNFQLKEAWAYAIAGLIALGILTWGNLIKMIFH
jgi:uncharacterized Zn finger protein